MWRTVVTLGTWAVTAPQATPDGRRLYFQSDRPLPDAAVIDKHLAAIGGRDALRAVKTMVVRGRNASLGAADRPLIRYLKPPHLFIVDGVTLNAALDDGLFLKRADSGEVVPTIAPGSDTRPFRHYAQ